MINSTSIISVPIPEALINSIRDDQELHTAMMVINSGAMPSNPMPEHFEEPVARLREMSLATADENGMLHLTEAGRAALLVLLLGEDPAAEPSGVARVVFTDVVFNLVAGVAGQDELLSTIVQSHGRTHEELGRLAARNHQLDLFAQRQKDKIAQLKHQLSLWESLPIDIDMMPKLDCTTARGLSGALYAEQLASDKPVLVRHPVTGESTEIHALIEEDDHLVIELAHPSPENEA